MSESKKKKSKRKRNAIQIIKTPENSYEKKKCTKITVKGCRDEINVTISDEKKAIEQNQQTRFTFCWRVHLHPATQLYL